MIEVLDRRGTVVQRVPVAALPATIGRAWTCDVILDDRHADPVHARLVQDESGVLVVEDSGSVNGLVADGRRTPRVPCAGPTTVGIGSTTVRVVPASYPVPAALPLQRESGLLAHLAGPRTALGVVGTGLALTLVSLWLARTSDDRLTPLVGGAVAVLAVTALWAGIWALAGRIAIHRPAFVAHLALVWLCGLVLAVVGLILDWIGFLLAVERHTTNLGLVVAAVLLAVLFYFHLGLATAQPPRVRASRAAVAVAVLVGLGAVLARAGEEFDGGVVAVHATLKAAPASLVVAGSVDRFLERAAAVRRAVDAEAAQPRRR